MSQPAEPADTSAPLNFENPQWVFTLTQRDTVRAAIKAEQAAGGHETAALALTAICAAYLTPTTAGEDQ